MCSLTQHWGPTCHTYRNKTAEISPHHSATANKHPEWKAREEWVRQAQNMFSVQKQQAGIRRMKQESCT